MFSTTLFPGAGCLNSLALAWVRLCERLAVVKLAAAMRPPEILPDSRAGALGLISVACWTARFPEKRMNAISFLAIGAGAACGAWLRWLLSVLINAVYPPVPLGTLTANLLGSFLMGIAMVLMLERGMFPIEVRMAVTTGFLASLTTMSTFSAETMSLVTRAEYAMAAGLVTLHVAGSLIMIFTGMLAARAVAGS